MYYAWEQTVLTLDTGINSLYQNLSADTFGLVYSGDYFFSTHFVFRASFVFVFHLVGDL